MADIKKLAEELVNLTVKDVNELASVLKMSTVLSQQQQQSVAAADAAGGDAGAGEEQTEFTVILKSAGELSYK